MRRLLFALWLALAALHFALGATWLTRNFDLIPDYGDSPEYVQLARSLKVDPYRGLAYPVVLAGIDRLPGSVGLVRPVARPPGSEARHGVIYLQVLQCLAAVAALAYFVRTLLAPVVPRAGPLVAGAGGAFVLLLFLDPLVAHFGLSVMTDSLALSGSLVYCASLAAFALGARRRVLHGTLFFLGYVLTSTLRPEKVWVLGCATVAALATWLWLERRTPAAERRLPAQRALALLGLAALASATVFGLNRSAREAGQRWPVSDSLVHSRIVFPNVTGVYDQLSKKTRARLSLQEAQLHDTNSIVGTRVIDDATGGSGPVRKKDREEAARTGRRPSAEADRKEMLQDIAGVVLRERWGRLLLDTLKDALENVFATFSFYVRLALLEHDGEISVADGTKKTYDVLSGLRPESSRRYLASSIALVLASTVLAAAALARRVRGRAPRIPRERLLAWVPVAAFVLVNGCAFALRADLVHIRYMLLAHVAFVALVLRGALDWLTAERADASAAS